MLEAERFCNPWLSYGFRHLYDLPVFPLTGFTEIHQVFFFFICLSLTSEDMHAPWDITVVMFLFLLL